MSAPGISGHFKNTVPLYERIKKCDELRNKYPNRIPCICERAKNANIAVLNNVQLLLPDDSSVSQLIFIIMRNLDLSETSSLFFVVDNKFSISGNQTMREIYSRHCDPEDKFLYISYAIEDVWG